jgi:acyl carrier protein
MKDEASLYPELTDIFHEVFGRDDFALTPALTAKDVAGWDSFKQIEIIVTVEEKYGIKLNTREIDSLKCVGDLVAVIARKVE